MALSKNDIPVPFSQKFKEKILELRQDDAVQIKFVSEADGYDLDGPKNMIYYAFVVSEEPESKLPICDVYTVHRHYNEYNNVHNFMHHRYQLTRMPETPIESRDDLRQYRKN
jgi:hypothetical protein